MKDTSEKNCTWRKNVHNNDTYYEYNLHGIGVNVMQAFLLHTLQTD